LKNGKTQAIDSKEISREKYVANHFTISVAKNDEVCMYKYAVNVASLYYAENDLLSVAKSTICRISEMGFEEMLYAHTQMWAKTWETADVVIEGDIAAQQGIRFNIFQLYQTYTGEDERLNIGPKGFTGEKYGGVTYWDTEAYCLPFYLRTTDQKVARNLLVYRYRHLAKAIENAEKLGFKDGAALYPMVTINGEECHNEWEITFEEIHRNGAIAYAIYNYVNYTGDEQYLEEYGLEVLIALSRFWRQRVNWSEAKQKFVMLGVTGPNEYENNVNNNWYTNKMAQWTLKYTINQLEKLEKQNPVSYKNLAKKVNLNGYDDANEQEVWFSIIEGLHFPEDVEKGIFLQQDGFCDKVIKPIHEIPVNERPINQNWSWDRILRSCYIKQADVLQGLYFLEDQFSMETIRRNFDFYEPITVHESSLSPCIHTILASRLGYEEKAYELYLRTTRLDLDDYNNDTEDGCHITSMAGTWMSIVEGFAGLRVRNDQLYFRPFIPGKWKTFRFMINFRGIKLVVKIGREEMTIENLSDHQINLYVYDLPYTIAAKEVFHEKIIHQLQVH
ncbi:MAG: family 65 glycosyl hydrolase domain-containing protein, partial [Cyclobacteriaceae bacterium]